MNCHDCYDYEERLAIIEYEGVKSAETSASLARAIVCVGCKGARGTDLFDVRVDLNIEVG